MSRLFKIVISVVLFVLVSCKPLDPNTTTSKYVFEAPVLYGTPKHLTSDNPLTNEGIDLGRHLFYDPILSIDYSLSCSSCHNQKFGFSDTAKLSKGVKGQRTDRHSMAISNTAWQNAFFWDGRVATLEQQALKPIQHPKEMGMDLKELVKRLKASEMYVKKFQCAFPGQEIDSLNIAKAIAQFEQTLVSSNSRYDQYKLGLITITDQEKRGERLFFTHPEEASGIIVEIVILVHLLFLIILPTMDWTKTIQIEDEKT
jgi:cytochrome c peroxidase